MNPIQALLLSVTIAIGLLSPSTLAFSPITTKTTFSPTALRSIIFEPPSEENCEVDGSDCEESVFAQKRRERAEADQAIKDRYQVERGITLTDVDLNESIDQYSNPAGGNLIPGVHLTSLCGDD